jgi:hypothetical protein
MKKSKNVLASLFLVVSAAVQLTLTRPSADGHALPSADLYPYLLLDTRGCIRARLQPCRPEANKMAALAAAAENQGLKPKSKIVPSPARLKPCPVTGPAGGCRATRASNSTSGVPRKIRDTPSPGERATNQNALAAGKTWGVVSSTPLDPRIQTQLEELAAQNQAELRSFATMDQARSARSVLSIELVAANSSEAFIAELQKLGTPGQGLTPELATEGYILKVSYQGPSPPSEIRIEAESPRGFHHGLLRVPQVLQALPANASALEPTAKSWLVQVSGRNSFLVFADFPSFPERGIVEGFYGTPWSSQDRLDMLRFEGQHGMNVYYYAPKDDPYHRKLWREPYPPEQMSALKEVVDAARANFVDFCFAISPGLSMTYSDDEEFAKLTTKLESVRKLGVSCFALFLDDVPPELQDPQDQARFKSVAAAHVYVVNKLYQYLLSQSPENRLTVTPTTYTNDWGSRDYIREMGAEVDPHVKLVWTGTKVVPPRITATEAREWGKLLQRKPLLWDNFPVNDGIPWRVNLGPLRGRDPDLAPVVSGFVSNPMNQAHASMIPLQTVADYLWNSRAYNPETAIERAIVDQYGQSGPELLQPFLKVYGDYWWDDNLFKPLFVETRKPFDIAPMERQIALLQSALEPLNNQERFQKLVAELSPFPAKTRTRLNEVAADEAFHRQPDGRLVWRDDYDVLLASKLGHPVGLETDAAKWPGDAYQLGSSSQVVQGADLWKGPEQFSARVHLGWDPQYLHIRVDVTDPQLNQFFVGRLIDHGDIFTLILDTAFRRRLTTGRAEGERYSLLFSPGNFADVPPSIFSEEDNLSRLKPRHYDKDIKTAWNKTPNGFSGDIAIPVFYFDGGKFQPGYEIGLSFGIQKALPLPEVVAATSPEGRVRAALKSPEELQLIVLTSKKDRLFPVRFGNPATYQRLVLQGGDERSRPSTVHSQQPETGQ